MSQRRVVIAWAVLGALVVAAFAGVVLILNSTLYSAGGFAGSYLAALSRHDVPAAVELAGPAPAGAKEGRELLDSRALGELDGIRLISDTDQGGGVHLVRYGFAMSAARGAAKTSGTATFTVERDGVRMGLFSGWRFASSPLGTLTVTPRHDAAFTVNGLQTSSSGPDAASGYLVLTPGLYELSHDSVFFTATPVPLPITKVGGATKATVEVRANASFTDQVQKGLDGELKKCATQKVLLPTGCPFGKEMGDRIEGTPVWSIVRYPAVKIVPGTTPGTWQVPKTEGAAHLVVKVRSIFDGSVSTFDQDVPFVVGYAIGFTADGNLTITSQ